MELRTYPYDAWVLNQHGLPKKVRLYGPTGLPGKGDTGDMAKKGKVYLLADLYPSKETALAMSQTMKENMRIQALHPNFILPTKGTEHAGAYDIYMPDIGQVTGTSQLVGLGFATEIPIGHVALLLPRSSVGAKFGLELNNTCGVIDADYRGEWKAALKTKNGIPYSWDIGDRLLQFLVVPVANITLELVSKIDGTERSGGFGSTGK